MARLLVNFLAVGPTVTGSFPIALSGNAGGPLVVAAGLGGMSVSSSWPGSDIVMSLVSPSGRVINRSTVDPLISHSVGPTFEVYNITLPEPGTWTVNFFGANVAPGGETVSYRVNLIPRAPGDADGDGVATCADLSLVKASFGKRKGQPGFDPRADLNSDGVVDIRDLSAVAQNILTGITCQ